MKIAVLLPTASLWGGVKRFLELGNRFVAAGHSFTVFTPDGSAPSWFPFKGETAVFGAIGSRQFDALFFTETALLPQVRTARSTVRIFYHVLRHEDPRPALRIPGISVFVNSSDLYEYDRRRYGITPFKAVGGVDTRRFCPMSRERGDETVVLTYGRLVMKRKGTRFVVRACERLHRRGFRIRLLLFDSPVSASDRRAVESFSAAVPFEFILDYPVERTNEIFNRADIFASAEKNAGWANTCAEAMACGLPVVATRSGSTDFLINRTTGLTVRRNSWSIERALVRLIRDKELAAQLGSNARQSMLQFDWDLLAARILKHIEDRIS